MPAVGKQRSGKGGRFMVGATNVTLAEFEATYHGDDLDTVHFECQGFDQGTIGILGLDFSVKGDWDAAQNRYDSPPGLFPRDDLSTVKLYESKADNVFWSMDMARILSAKNGAQTRGKVTFECTGKSQGIFSPPTGSV